jgi:hypothetical protein
MPLILNIAGLLLTLASSLPGRVLLALGMSYVTYSGFDTSVNWLLDQVKSNMSQMGADTVSFLAWLWVDKAIGMIFAAYTAALTVKMAGSTKLTKLVTKGS